MLNVIYTKKFKKDLIEIQKFIWEDNILYSIKTI